MCSIYLGIIGSLNFFFFNDTATTEIYTLSLHDALPISLHAVPRRADRSAALDDLGVDAACDLRGDEPRGGRGATPLVRDRRAGCARANRRIEGCPRTPAKIRRALCARLPVSCPGVLDLWERRGADHRRELRQHAHPALLGQRARRHLAVRLAPDRRARSRARHALELAACARGAARDHALRAPGGRGRGHGLRDRAAARPRRLSEARIEPRVVARRLAARRGGARRACRSALDEPCGRPGSGERPRARRLRARPLVRRVAVEDLSMKVGLLMEAAETQQALAAAALEQLRAHAAGLDGIVREEIRATLIEELGALDEDSRRAGESLRALKQAH